MPVLATFQGKDRTQFHEHDADEHLESGWIREQVEGGRELRRFLQKERRQDVRDGMRFCWECFDSAPVGHQKRCQRCRKANYCSQACQRANWQYHRIFTCSEPWTEKQIYDEWKDPDSWLNRQQEKWTEVNQTAIDWKLNSIRQLYSLPACIKHQDSSLASSLSELRSGRPHAEPEQEDINA